MKISTLITTLTCCLLSLTVFAQVSDNTNRHNETNIYYQALKQYLHFRDTSYLKRFGLIDTIFVAKDRKTTDSLLDRIGNTRLIYIEDPYTYIKNAKQKRMTLYDIFPLEYSNNEFSILFIPFEVSIDKKRKRGLILENQGGYKIVFRFQNGQFFFIRVEV